MQCGHCFKQHTTSITGEGGGVVKDSPDVGHVGHEVCANLVGDGAEAGVVPLAGVCGASADDHLGAEVQCLLLQLVVVDQARLQMKLQWHFRN